MKRLYLLLIFLVCSISLFSQVKNHKATLNKRRINLERQIQELTDSLDKVNKELKHIENQKYLAQFENSSGLLLTAKCRMDGKLRKSSDPWSKILTIVKEGEPVNLTDYRDGYWVVNKGPHYGYMSELYFEETEPIKRFKEELEHQNELIRLEQEKQDEELRRQKKKKEEELRRQKEITLQAARDEASRQQKIEKEKHRQALISKYGQETGQKLFEGYYWIGMTKEMAEISLGKPNRTNKSVGSWGTHEQWIYYSTYLYFENGYLTSYQNSN